MAASIIGALRVVLGLDSAQFEDGISAAQKELAKAGRKFQAVGQQIAGVGVGLSAAISAPLAALAVNSARAAQESAEAMGQVEAALKSMGGQSGKTAADLSEAAAGLQKLSTFDDDDILRKVTANLLTFGNVSGQVFDRAQLAAVDLSARLGQDLQSSAIQVGKALNDPLKGVTALQRVGVSFTEQQKAQIKAMTAAGNAAGAQGIILAELEKQFGGSAKAMRDATPGADLIDAWREFQETVGAIVLKILPPLTAMLTKVVAGFNSLSPGMQSVALAGAAFAAAVGPVLIVVGGLVSGIGALLPVIGAIGAPFLLAAAAVAGLAAVFWIYRDEIIPLVQDFGKAVSDVVGPKLTPLFDALKSAVSALGEVFVLIFSPKGDAGEAMTNFNIVVSRVFGAVVEIITAALQTISGVIRGFAALLRGDFSGAWTALKDVAAAQLRGLANVVATLFPEMVAWAKKTFDGVKLWLVDKFDGIVQAIRSKLLAVSGFFRDLWDAVVGHSYIPDMVEGVAAWMAKLDAGMVTPARNATAKTKAAFQKLRDDLAPIMEGLLTDQERAARELAVNAKVIGDALDAGELTPFAAAQAARRDAVAHGAKDPNAITPITADSNPGGFIPANDDAFKGVTEGINATRDAWGSAFADGIEGVLYGDLKNVLKNWAADWARSGLEDAGKALFDMLKGGGLKKAFSSVASFFAGGGKLPGFKNGGSFTVGGSSGIDSNIVAFRATKGETVDIRKPGQDMGAGVKVIRLITEASPYFDQRVVSQTQPMVQEYSLAAADGGATIAENRMATRRRTTLGSGRR